VLPSLRERVGDIPLLIEHFLREASETCGRQIDGFDSTAMSALQSYSWPGNVRQLENVVERAVLLSRDEGLTMEDLPPEISGHSTSELGGGMTNTLPMQTLPDEIDGKTLREALEGPEREIILQALRLHHWNRASTADALDINRTTLYKKMKRLGLDDPRLQFV